MQSVAPDMAVEATRGTLLSAMTPAMGTEEAEAALLPGLYCIEVNMLQGLHSFLPGPWTDMAESAYEALRQRGLHTSSTGVPAALCQAV